MIELAMELTEKGAILPDGKALMTVEIAQAFIEKRFGILEMAVTERVSAALHRHDQLNYDLKGYQRAEATRGGDSIRNSCTACENRENARYQAVQAGPRTPWQGKLAIDGTTQRSETVGTD